jgi:GTPase SAR1 family protein
MPSKHLLSNPMLAQALSITEAAVLVYSVRDEASFRLAQGLAEFMREHLAPAPASPTVSRSILPSLSTTTTSNGTAAGGSSGGVNAGSGGGVGGVSDKGRIYPLILVGNKSDPPSHTDDDDPVAILQSERAVAWEEGLKAAAGMRMPGTGADVVFLEVSAKTGEGVDKVFEVLGQEVLRVRRVVRERREVAERERMMGDVGSVKTAGGDGGRKKGGLWRVLFGRRRVVGEGVR